MNSKSDFNTNTKMGGEHQWLSMSEASQFTPYSAEYLSLLARKGKLPAKKIGKTWFTTRASLDEYMHRQMVRAKIQKGVLGVISSRQGIPESSLNLINFIRGRLTHGLAEKIIEEKKPDSSQSVLIEEIKKLSESVGGLSNKIETITTLKREEPSKEEFLPEKAPESESEKLPIAEITEKESNIFFEKFTNKFNKFLDSSIEEHFGLFHRAWTVVKNSFKSVFSHSFLFSLFIVALILLMVFPARSIFGFVDDALNGAWNKLRDAQTVLGFRPGTHENEILLLDKRGNISISGHIETEGQFRSFVKDGIAPIVVDSKTKVENLNADYLDNLHAEEFTLAYVTKNGNITTEDVYLDGKVEVGRTLLVKGATRLLSSLEVDGEISVFGNANFKKSLNVGGAVNAQDVVAAGIITGRTVSAQLVNAPTISASQSLASDGNFNVGGQSVFGGFAFFNSGLQARSGDFDISLGVGGDFSATGNVRLGYISKDVNITSQNWYIAKSGAASFAALNVSGTSTLSNLNVFKLNATIASTTQLSVSDYFWSNGTTTIGNQDSDVLNINSTVWNLASSTATTTVAMTSGIDFTSGTFVIDPYSNRVGIGTTSPFATLSVAGQIAGDYFTAVATSATSTFAGGIEANLLNVTSSSATSTFANGIQISAGCFRLPDGSCAGIGGGGGITSLNGLNAADQTFATTSDANITLSITSSGSIHTFSPGWTGTLAVDRGGTGWNNLYSNSILLGNGAGAVATTSSGTDGEVLALFNGVPTWQPTTTLATIIGTLDVNKGGTGANSFGQGWLYSTGGTSALAASTSPTVNYITATSTSIASTIPYASSTALTVSGTGYFGTTDYGGTATSTGSQLTASGAYLINSGSLLSINTSNNQPVTFGNGKVTIPYASTTALTVSGTASTTDLYISGNAYGGTFSLGIWNGGIIDVGYGGTGSTTLTGILKGNGTNPIQTAVGGIRLRISSDFRLSFTAFFKCN